MADVVIENPILNSPFEEPKRHFRFDKDGITNEILESRRVSSYFVPIAKPKKKGGGQLSFQDTEWTEERIEENALINRIRQRVKIWRESGYSGVTNTTARLLEHWNDPDKVRRLFFCQIEAVETIIYITEAAQKYGDSWIHEEIRQANETSNPGLYRMACKLATGAGKTTVMGMLIAWHTLNKAANPQDSRFSDCFLVVAPGITIRDRLRVLLPSDPATVYKALNLVPADLFQTLGRATIVITNYHAFKLREKVEAPKLVKSVLGQGETSLFTETPAEMVRRVCKPFGAKKNIVVLQDECHHCYRKKQAAEEDKLTGEAKKEAEERNKAAALWISGVEAVKAKLGTRAIYDLSATPFYLRGSGYSKKLPDGKVVSEGLLFPWVVSDFSLIDAIEAGIVKVPRVPVQDNAGDSDVPTYRELWERIKEDLPRKGRKTEEVTGEPKLSPPLEGALRSLYANYEKSFLKWQQNDQAEIKGQTPPVFIVVCSNTNVSKLIFDWIAGWEKTLSSGEKVIVPGALPIFSNEENGGWRGRPNTILVDSTQLDSGEAMTADFKKMAAPEIKRFKEEYALRYPGRDPDKLKDEDILREVMNTVGKAGTLGGEVRCVVSVSMLTEGWDANTVTHILGVRAFGTQLLCEQVVGRGLRRVRYAINDEGRFEPEYAEVYGVPFSFIPSAGSKINPKPPKEVTRVRALDSRIACEITFPRVVGYRYDVRTPKLTAKFTDDSHYSLSTQDVATLTVNAPIVGSSSTHTLDDLKGRRMKEVAFLLAKLVLEKYFRQEPAEDEDRPEGFVQEVQTWRFPDLLRISEEWLDQCVTCKDGVFPQLLLFTQLAHNAADRIYRSIVQASEAERTLQPILRPYDTVGSTRYVDFDTTKPTMLTQADKCHISHVVADTGSWEQKVAEVLEEIPEVLRYVKNQSLGFTIPYTSDGVQKNYIPDYIAVLNDRDDPEDLLNLIIEVTGEKKKEKEAKVATAKALWVPAINNHGGYGRWRFVEITDPWDCGHLLSIHDSTPQARTISAKR